VVRVWIKGFLVDAGIRGSLPRRTVRSLLHILGLKHA
jgi:hypothetical protein